MLCFPFSCMGRFDSRWTQRPVDATHDLCLASACASYEVETLESVQTPTPRIEEKYILLIQSVEFCSEKIRTEFLSHIKLSSLNFKLHYETSNQPHR